MSTTASPSSADTGQPFAAALGFANIGLQAYQTYTAGETAKSAVNKLNSNSLMYVILGLGGLGVLALLVFKH